ncbi:MAG: SprT family zinc-dependent metalloprotease [Moraxellaceae bacterium]|nr:SprT family zinc-dependent metalloprotease [Moraxellaceae bacterium]
MPESRQGEWKEYRHDSGAILPFRFIRSARKNLTLYVNRDGSVLVRAPLRMALAHIFLFMHERWEWMQLQRARFLDEPAPAKVVYEEGGLFMHLGVMLTLRLHDATHNLAQRHGDELHVAITPERLAEPDGLAGVIELWQRREARRVFPLRLAFAHEAMKDLHLPFPELKVRKMRTRWGSCTRSGVVTLNLELIRMPPECIDYVITHELCHLIEFNHSERFYKLQERYMPEWKARKHELEELARRHYCL